MGLDMYLRAEKYVSGYPFRDEEERGEYQRLVEMFDVQEAVDPDTPSVVVKFTVAYWRKANQIHLWFVQNVQGGEDECRPHYVSRGQLKDLREACLRVIGSTELVPGEVENGVIFSAEHPAGVAQIERGKVMKDATLARELLPTASGFFFGSTDYNQWYWEDLKETVKQIDRALALPDEWDFEYQSSW